MVTFKNKRKNRKRKHSKYMKAELFDICLEYIHLINIEILFCILTQGLAKFDLRILSKTLTVCDVIYS